MRRALLLTVLVAAAAGATAQEVPRHGLVFEQWVRDTFFRGYKPASPTQRWDIPATENRDHGGIPVNPKAVKHGTAIDLGDALRQYGIDEPFLLVAGFWQQDGVNKRIVRIAAVEIRPELWRQLWTPVTFADLRKLDDLIKDTGRPVEELRRLALKIKNSPPFSEAVIQVNPGIDPHGQRRLRCSLRFADFFTHLAPGTDPAPQAQPALWGVEYPGPIAAPPRGRKLGGSRFFPAQAATTVRFPAPNPNASLIQPQALRRPTSQVPEMW
ncbi:MAG: hypothetical protein HYV75_02605 [Opitutae bacterium]|nr:hypothetical protein [Opitutae bacterium]